MSQALYRTYRPRCFGDIVGQNPIRITLENEIEHNRIAHAYLFSGPRGVGKTTTARIVAKAVNCTKRKGAEPCDACDSCRDIAAGKSLDLIEIDAASHTGVDNVRENIIENARFTPQRAKYKVFIIDEVHMLSVSAFNALLKTLEEPPEHVIFILATTEIHRLPETIISRCQRFDFKRVGVADLTSRIQFLAKAEKVTIDEAIVATIARRAEGSVRDAEVLLAQIMALGEKHITMETASLVIPRSNSKLIVELFSYLVHRNPAAGLQVINTLVEEGVSIQDFTKEFIEFLRTVLLLKVSNAFEEFSNVAIDQKTITSVQQDLAVIDLATLLRMVEVFSAKARELKYAPIIQLPLELGVLEITAEGAETPARPSYATPTAKKPEPPTSADPIHHEKKTPPAPSVKKTKSAITLEHIKEIWPKLLKELQKHNHSFSLSLKVGCPVAIDDTSLTIGFRYKFHEERIKDRKIKNSVENILEKVIGAPLLLKTTLVSQEDFEKLVTPVVPQTVPADSVQNVMQTFGGDLIAEE